MEFIHFVYGLFCLISMVVAFFVMQKSSRKISKEIEDSSKSSSIEKQYNNSEAVSLAKRYFESFEKGSFRNYSKYILSDRDLPVTLNISRFNLVAIPVSLLMSGIGMGFVIREIKPFEIIAILNLIPIPGIILHLTFLVIIVAAIFSFKNISTFCNTKLVIEPLCISYISKKEQILLRYSDFHIVITPIKASLLFQLTSKKMRNIRKINSVFLYLSRKNTKTLWSTLVVKSIEYGNLHTGIGIE